MIEKEEDRRDAGMYDRAFNRLQGRSEPEAPERTPPQRESSGQFRSSEPVFGEEKLERDAGYKPLKDDREEIDSDRISIRDASNERAKELQTKPIEVHESGLDENITLKVEQAAKRVEEARKADVDQAELDGTKAAQKAVDDLRNPTGVEPQKPQQIEAEPDIESVLKHPKIAKALQERVTEAETQRQHFETSVQEIGKMRIAALASEAPELMNLPLEKWAPAINNLAQHDLPKAKQIVAKLHALGEVENALIQIKAQKETREKAEFAQYSARENQRFKELTKNIPAKEMEAITAHVPVMLAEAGVENPRAFLEAIQGQTTFPRASAEALFVKAAKYDLLQKARKAVLPRSLPPVPRVQPPGVAAPRGNSASTNLQALNAALAKGDLKAAGKMIATNRKATRR